MKKAANEVSELDEILTLIKSTRREPRLPHHLCAKSQVVEDLNHERKLDKAYSRVVKLQCTRCHAFWNACYEGPLPRHREDLICYRCSR